MNRPSPRVKKWLRAVRTEVREGESFRVVGGQCGTVSEAVACALGWPDVWGTHEHMRHDPDDEHVWNRLPDGRILDVTADQFGTGLDVAILPAGHPAYRAFA